MRQGVSDLLRKLFGFYLILNQRWNFWLSLILLLSSLLEFSRVIQADIYIYNFIISFLKPSDLPDCNGF